MRFLHSIRNEYNRSTFADKVPRPHPFDVVLLAEQVRDINRMMDVQNLDYEQASTLYKENQAREIERIMNAQSLTHEQASILHTQDKGGLSQAPAIITLRELGKINSILNDELQRLEASKEAHPKKPKYQADLEKRKNFINNLKTHINSISMEDPNKWHTELFDHLTLQLGDPEGKKQEFFLKSVAKKIANVFVQKAIDMGVTNPGRLFKISGKTHDAAQKSLDIVQKSQIMPRNK
jgi:hypothetical protein